MIYLLGCLLFIAVPLNATEDESHEHLSGFNFLHMRIDGTLDDEVTAMERLDLSDIMELQLRRGNIEIRPFIANQAEACVPLLVLSIDTSNRLKTGEFYLILQVRDRVIIKRNKHEVVATTFELRRSGRAESNEVETIKSVLRQLMEDFVNIYREQNPRPSLKGEEE